MAVPSSGVLDYYSIAQECYYGTYGSGTITGIIGFKELVIGGQAGSGGLTYPEVSGNAPPPDLTAPYSSDEWYDYDKDFVPSNSSVITPTSVPKPVFACGQTVSVTVYYTGTFSNGTTCYTDAARTTTHGAGNFGVGLIVATARFTFNSGGVISSLTLC